MGRKLKKKIIDTLGKTAPQLIFAVFAGCGYFMILLPVIMHFSKGSPFLAIQFSPAIICGAALVLIQLMKQVRANEKENKIFILFIIHILLFVMGIVFTVAAFIK